MPSPLARGVRDTYRTALLTTEHKKDAGGTSGASPPPVSFSHKPQRICAELFSEAIWKKSLEESPSPSLGVLWSRPFTLQHCAWPLPPPQPPALWSLARPTGLKGFGRDGQRVPRRAGGRCPSRSFEKGTDCAQLLGREAGCGAEGCSRGSPVPPWPPPPAPDALCAYRPKTDSLPRSPSEVLPQHLPSAFGTPTFSG